MARGLLHDADDEVYRSGDSWNTEYVRGMIELIIDLFGVDGGMDGRDDVAKAIHPDLKWT